MQYSFVAVLALAAGAMAGGKGNVTWVTTTVESFVTVCPEATTFSYGSITYTATASETITITDCPCTVSSAISTIPTTISTSCTTSAAAGYTGAYSNGTVSAATTVVATTVGTTSVKATASASATTSAIVSANNGNKMMAFSGASLAGLLGVAAYVL